MASKAPPVPRDQRRDGADQTAAPEDPSPEVARDPAGGDRDVNLKEQGRPGNLRQNLINQGRQQDR